MDWNRRRLHVYRNEWGEYVFKIGDSRACLDSGEAEELAGEILDLSILKEQLEAQDDALRCWINHSATEGPYA